VPFWDKKKPVAEAPGWAHPLTGTQYTLFLLTLKSVLDALGIPGQRDPSPDGSLELRNAEGEITTAGLMNLAQTAASVPTSDWPALIDEHFQSMMSDEGIPQSAAEASPVLRVRLWHPDFAVQATKGIYKTLAYGLIAGLAVDLPRKVMGASGDHLAAWGLSASEAWEIAEINSRNEPCEVIPSVRSDGTELRMVIGDSWYLTSHALWIDQHVEIESERGALLGVPTRHLLVVFAIHDLRVLSVVGNMRSSNQRIFDEGPGSISPEVYWWRQGRFTLIPIDIGVQPGKIVPPDGFVALLNTLPPIPG
jgi:hypothetical protein